MAFQLAAKDRPESQKIDGLTPCWFWSFHGIWLFSVGTISNDLSYTQSVQTSHVEALWTFKQRKCRTLGLLLKSVVCFDNKRFKNRKKTHIHACIKFIFPIYFSILFHFFSILLHVSNTVHTVDSTQYKDNLGLKVQSYSGLSNMLSVQNISNRLLCAWSKLCRRVKAKSVIAYQFEEMGVQNKKQNKTVPNVGQDIWYICYWWQMRT